jgi:two-component system phosphoglycerate transport system sensor histidine kinase PgtB
MLATTLFMRSWRSWIAACGAAALGLGLYRFDNWYEAMDSSWVKSFLDAFEVCLMGPGTGLLTWLVMERSRHLDISHRQRLELERNQRFSQLGRIAASVAHEVRNPLHNLRLISEGLRAESASPPVAALLTRLEVNLERLNQATMLAYELARPARALDETEATDIDLPTLVDDVIVETALRLARPCPIDHRRPDVAVTVRGREPALRIVLGNLVRNAIEAGVGAPISVDYQRAAESWTILLANSGALEPRLLADAGAHPSTKPDGLGVGLSISRHLLPGLSARLEFTSNVGIVTARLTLPASSNRPPEKK